MVLLFLATMLLTVLCAQMVLSETVKLTMAHWMFPRSAAYKEGIEEAIASFRAKYPNVEIELLVPGTSNDPFIQGIKTWYVAGNSPDIIGVDAVKMQSFWPDGILLDLNPFIEKDPSFRFNMIYPWTWEGMVFNGKRYGVPREVYHRELFLNNDLFAEGGVSIPSNDWTWNEFVDYARKLTRDTDGDATPDIWGWQSAYTNLYFLHAWGGSFYIDNGRKVGLLMPEAIEAFEQLLALEREMRVAPTAAQEKAAGGTTAMTQNSKIAIFHADIYSIPSNTYSFDYTLRLFPIAKQRAVSSFVNGFGISSASKHPELAWAFLSHLLSADVLYETFVKRDYVSPFHDVNSRGIFPSSNDKIRQQIMFGLNATTVNEHGELVIGPMENATMVRNELNTTIREGKEPVRQVMERLMPVLQANLDEFRSSYFVNP
ncbi:MAG TPA: extracellular solute-binding protein [Firmicutes bacterium]|nr:extracellular solute-binding protein [Bacillota bacterium]